MRLRFATNVPLLVEDAERVLARNDFMVMPHGTLVDLPHVDLFRDSWVVLVAEDNDDTRDFLVLTLQNEGYDVVTAPNGQAALELAEGDVVGLGA